MKWLFLFIALASLLPLSKWLRRNPARRLQAFVLIGFLPGLISYLHLYMAIDSWDWIGYVRGMEVSLLDLIAIAVYLSFPGVKGRLPFRFSMACYLIATLLSAPFAEFPMTAIFYSWQLARMFLVYAAIYRASCADDRVPAAILKGMAAGIFLEAALAITQRVGFGMLQAHGTYIHQNTLGLISHFTVLPFFALLLGGRRGWLPPMVLVAGLIVEVLTTSRGTIVLGAAGLATIFLLSAARRWTPRKGRMLLVGVAAVALFAPMAASSLQERFSKTDESFTLGEDSERLRYKEAASAMLTDHPMGVGANNFTYAANRQGYFDLVGENYLSGRSGNVHNLYWLVAAETGYLGLITLVIFLLRPLMVAFACGWRNLGDPRGDLLLGLGVTLAVVYFHSSEEWVFVTFDVQYSFAIAVGLVAALAQGLGYWRKAQA